MAVTSAQVSVGTTETALSTTAHAPGRVIISVPSGGQAVFIGPTGVTTSNGFSLAPGATVTVNVDAGEVLFGIVAATTQTTHVLRS